MEIGIFGFHLIKSHFKATYQLMRVTSEERTLSEGTIFSVGNGKCEGLQPSGARFWGSDDEHIIFFCLEVFLKVNDALKDFSSEPKALIEVKIAAIPPFFSRKCLE